YTVEHYLPTELRDGARPAWLDTAWRGLASSAPGSDAQLSWARALGRAAAFDDGRADDLRALLDGEESPPEGLPLDADLRWIWVQALAATGAVDEDAIRAELARDDTMSGRTEAVEALAARPSADVRAAAWRAAWTD